MTETSAIVIHCSFFWSCKFRIKLNCNLIKLSLTTNSIQDLSQISMFIFLVQ